MENITENTIDYIFLLVIVSGIFSMAFLRFIDAILMFSPITGRKILSFLYTILGFVLINYDFTIPGSFLLLTGLITIVNVLIIEYRVQHQMSIVNKIKETIETNEESIEPTHTEEEAKENEANNTSA